MVQLIKIAETGDLAPGQARAFELAGKRIALFNVAGNYYAIDDTCPHSGGPISEGSVEGSMVACPWHGAEFDLRTGEVLSQPANENVKSYKVIVEGKDIKIEV